MDDKDLLNPFRTWAELTAGLRDRFVVELGISRPFSPYCGEVLGMLAEMITRCNHVSTSLEKLRETDQPAYDAFLRALERS